MKTEIGFVGLFLVGLAFKFQELPGAGMFLTIACLALAVMYFPGAFYFFSGKTTKDQNVPLSIAAGVWLSVALVGILFKLQHFPGSSVMLLVGGLAAVILLAVTAWLRSKDTTLRPYYNRMLVRTGVLATSALLLYIF